MRLTREQILAANDCPSRELAVPEWGGTITLATLGAHDRIQWEQAAFPEGKVDVEQYMAGLVQRTIVDENGQPVFTAEDFEALRNKNPAVIKRIFDVAAELNGVGEKAAKEAEKNSEATPVSDTASS